MIILLFFLFSCSRKIIDIDGPILENFFQDNKSIVLQFDEPVVNAKILYKSEGKEYFQEINNIFPVANNTVFLNNGIKNHKIIFSVEAVDTVGNKTSVENKELKLNLDPVKVIISQVSVKAGKKSGQKIVLKIVKSGYLYGFSLVICHNKKSVKIPFAEGFLSVGREFELSIEKSGKEGINKSEEIIFTGNNVSLVLTEKLSNVYGLIYICNNSGEIEDYYLYYNSKEHDQNYYAKNKTFNFYKRLLILNNIENILSKDIYKNQE